MFDFFDLNLDVDDLLDGNVVGFAIDTFDTFVFDTGMGANTNVTGSIWQQGWDYIDQMWGGNQPDMYGDYEGYLETNLLEDTPAAKMAFNQSASVQPQGLLGRMSTSFKKKANDYVDSGDWVEDAGKGLLSMAKGHYASKKREKELEELNREAEKRSRIAKHGFTTHRKGFAR